MKTSAKIAILFNLSAMLMCYAEGNVCGLLLNGFVFIGIILLNKRINNSSSQSDRVLWELSNLSVFNAKDKDFVAECIESFVENNMAGDPEYQESDHIIERFRLIAEDIRNLPREVKYFVIKGTSVDDNVERWFYKKRLCSWQEFICEFTLIEDQKVAGFATNLEMCKGGG